MDVSLQISRLLSFSVVGLSFFMKLPQVIDLLSSRSTEGLNLRTYWMEIGTYLIGFSYGYTHGYHLSTYAEAGLLAIQDAIIIFLIIYYDKRWSLENFAATLVSFVFIATSYYLLVPHFLLGLLISMTLPLSAASKLAQINTIYQIKSKGNVSVLTWSLAGYGCLARLYTVYVEVEDLQILLNFLVSFVLNSTVVIACLYYGKANHHKFS